MKLIADLHTHTIASTHAYATLNEMAQQAVENGLKALAITDHAPGMPSAPNEWYFTNMRTLPDILPNGLLLLRGAEVNGLNTVGELDLSPEILKNLDWVVVSLHRVLTGPMDFEESTNFWLKIAQTPYVDMIGHSEQREFQYDYDRVTKAFTQNNKVVELNACSAAVRPGNEANMQELILCCKRNQTKVAINSDAHSTYGLGNQGPLAELLEELEFPPELVINSSLRVLLDELELHGRAIAKRVRERLL